jgi:hypothetical protein
MWAGRLQLQCVCSHAVTVYVKCVSSLLVHFWRWVIVQRNMWPFNISEVFICGHPKSLRSLFVVIQHLWGPYVTIQHLWGTCTRMWPSKTLMVLTCGHWTSLRSLYVAIQNLWCPYLWSSNIGEVLMCGHLASSKTLEVLICRHPASLRYLFVVIQHLWSPSAWLPNIPEVLICGHPTSLKVLTYAGTASAHVHSQQRYRTLQALNREMQEKGRVRDWTETARPSQCVVNPEVHYCVHKSQPLPLSWARLSQHNHPILCVDSHKTSNGAAVNSAYVLKQLQKKDKFSNGAMVRSCCRGDGR